MKVYMWYHEHVSDSYLILGLKFVEMCFGVCGHPGQVDRMEVIAGDGGLSNCHCLQDTLVQENILLLKSII